ADGACLRDRRAGRQAGTLFQRAAGAGYRHLARGPGGHQHGCKHGAAPDQRPDVAVLVVRWQRPARQLLRARFAAAGGLGEQAVDERSGRVNGQPDDPDAKRTRDENANRAISRTILIMAGGTGGHVFPALAVAADMSSAGWRVVWLGSP